MNIESRKYRPTDYNSLYSLLNGVYNSQIEKIILEENYINEYKNIIVAFDRDNSKVVGSTFFEIKIDYIRPSKILYITYVAVDEQYRRQGIGRNLIFEAMKLCKIHDCSAIELTSANYRVEAHKFYSLLGFTPKKTTLFIKEMENENSSLNG